MKTHVISLGNPCLLSLSCCFHLFLCALLTPPSPVLSQNHIASWTQHLLFMFDTKGGADFLNYSSPILSFLTWILPCSTPHTSSCLTNILLFSLFFLSVSWYEISVFQQCDFFPPIQSVPWSFRTQGICRDVLQGKRRVGLWEARLKLELYVKSKDLKS